jgi:hypothetical protein
MTSCFASRLIDQGLFRPFRLKNNFLLKRINMTFFKIQTWLALSLLVMLAGCGGGGGGGSSPVVETGILFDAALANVAYSSPTLSGVTNASGEFEFAIGETVVFSIGNYDFPAVAGAKQMSLVALLNSNGVDNAVINLARLLQSIDTNPDAGVITLPENIDTDISSLNFNKSLEAFEADSIVLELLAQHSTQTTFGQLISAQEAVEHLYDSAADLGITLPPLTIEQDIDSDGILNIDDLDDDNDNVADLIDVDDDNDGLIEIRSLADLDDILNHLFGSMQYGNDDGCLEGDCIGFELTQHLDFDTNNDGVMDAEDTYYNYDGGNGNGWLPLGQFEAVFDGNNYEIRNLFINRPATNDNGLFGHVVSSELRNIGLNGELMSVTGSYPSGGLVGFVEESTISNSYATGAVTSLDAYQVGGLVGLLYNGSTISNSYATGAVTGPESIGGLVGYVYESTVINSYATGKVTGIGVGHNIGGLMGTSELATIIDSEASGNVTGDQDSYRYGGLVGYLANSSVTNSNASGNVTGGESSSLYGGLVGTSEFSTITDSEASGDVRGDVNTESYGGLVGYAEDTVMTNSDATGAVTGKNNIGGLVGKAVNNTIITDSEASGSVTGKVNTYDAGGLVGYASDTTITRSTALGAVTCDIYSHHVGGLVGQTTVTTITDSNASGDVTSGENSTDIGGLVGDAIASAITDSEARGDVTGSEDVGELVGSSDDNTTITGSTGTGAVTVILPSD